MSIHVMSRVWNESKQTGTALLALLALADWANDRGDCDPSYRQLAAKVRVTRRSAIRIVDGLIAAGEVIKTIGAGHEIAKDAVSNRLTLARYAVFGPASTHKAPGVANDTSLVTPATLPQCHDGHQPSDTSDTTPSDNHVTTQQSTTTVNNNLNTNVNTPPPPTVQAGQPGGQVAESTVPTRGQGSATPSRAPRSTKTDRSSSTEGGSEARGGRWAPVAAAIMAAIGRPAPRGKLPAWLGNTVATFGAAAGDDPERALTLVTSWAKSRPLREALERGIVRDHTVPALAGSWIVAGNAGQPPADVARRADPEELRMQRLGAPDNWRDIVYAPGGVKRSPVLALPRMGLEPYAQQGTWPAWYRAFEGVRP